MYKVTKQYGKAREAHDREFKTLNEAQAHCQQAAESDAAMRVAVIYRIYEFDEVVFEVDSMKVQPPTRSESSGSGKGSSSTFNPSPLNTTMKPKGAVQHWKKPDDEDDNK